MQVMLGMLPMLVGGKVERISTAKGGEDLREEREFKGERVEKIFGRKKEPFSGGTGPKGQWGDRISNGKGGKRLWEEKGGDLGGKSLRGETGERILSGKGGKRS